VAAKLGMAFAGAGVAAICGVMSRGVLRGVTVAEALGTGWPQAATRMHAAIDARATVRRHAANAPHVRHDHPAVRRLVCERIAAGSGSCQGSITTESTIACSSARCSAEVPA
jgi:hypothetical protein